MKPSLQQRLTFGTLFLFALMLFGSVLGLVYLVRVDDASKAVLADNYDSVRYIHGMQRELERPETEAVALLAGIDSLLRAQEANITEPGEAAITQRMRERFNALRSGAAPVADLRAAFRTDLNTLLDLNLRAIDRKSGTARVLARRALFWLFLSAVLLVLVGLGFSVAFPSVMSAPLVRLKEAAQEVATRNYRHRIPPFAVRELDELATAFNDMAAALEAYDNSNLAQLMAEKDRAEAVINSLQDAGLGVGPDGRVLFANRPALQLLGLTPESLVGHDLQRVRQQHPLLDRLLRQPGTVVPVDTGERAQHYLTTALPLQSRQGALGTLYVVRNITTFHERDQARTNFLATISHELKTPLASSDIGLTLLERGTPANDDREAILHDLRKDHQRLTRIVGELLDLAQAETGHLRLQVRPTALAGIVHNALDAVRTSAQGKQLRTDVHVDGSLPEVLADPDKAAWVLVNVLSNAVRHAPRGSLIALGARTIDGQVELRIADQGPGVPPEDRERIFQRFTGHAPGGTGLGLSIAREFMQAMGGSIAMDPHYTDGAAFVLRFPIAS